MCKVAMAGLGGGGYNAFNELFKERKRVGVVGEDGWSRNGDLEGRGWGWTWPGLGKILIRGFDSPPASFYPIS